MTRVPQPGPQQDEAWHLMDRIYKKVCSMTQGQPPPTTAFYDFGVPILAAALSASRIDPPVADPWQPIESAPKDGTEILVLHRGEFMSVVWWEETFGGWIVAALAEQSIYADNSTHWMPLPAPPSGSPASPAASSTTTTTI